MSAGFVPSEDWRGVSFSSRSSWLVTKSCGLSSAPLFIGSPITDSGPPSSSMTSTELGYPCRDAASKQHPIPGSGRCEFGGHALPQDRVFYKSVCCRSAQWPLSISQRPPVASVHTGSQVCPHPPSPGEGTDGVRARGGSPCW